MDSGTRKGGGTTKAQTYFAPHEEMDTGPVLPVEGARLHVFGGGRPEALLIVDRAGGIAIAGDSLQHSAVPDEFFNWPGRMMMRPLGFLKPHNIGPGWLKRSKPPREHFAPCSRLPFENVLPSHGAPTIGGAREAYRPAIERAARSVRTMILFLALAACTKDDPVDDEPYVAPALRYRDATEEVGLAVGRTAPRSSPSISISTATPTS